MAYNQLARQAVGSSFKVSGVLRNARIMNAISITGSSSINCTPFLTALTSPRCNDHFYFEQKNILKRLLVTDGLMRYIVEKIERIHSTSPKAEVAVENTMCLIIYFGCLLPL